jgi:hypothetical protein
LLLAIYDLELAIVRLETAEALFAVLPREELCRQLRVTRGRWSDYTYAAWMFDAMAALERAERLATSAWRTLIKPHPAPQALDEAALTDKLKDYVKSIKKLRDPQAHGDSTVEVFADRRGLDEWAVLGRWPPVDDVIEQLPARTYPRQSQMAHEMTRRYFEAIDATAGAIVDSVDWAAVT